MNYEFSILNLKRAEQTIKKRLLAALLAAFTFSLFNLCTFQTFADTSTPTQSTTKGDNSLPTVTTIPNPARGKKMTFRVMATGPCKVRIRIYNRFFDPVAKLEQEGDHLFDILWSLKNVSDGPYIYQVLVDDKTTGETLKLPQQKFWVMKDETPAPKRKKP